MEEMRATNNNLDGKEEVQAIITISINSFNQNV